jgi:hypothetical protein
MHLYETQSRFIYLHFDHTDSYEGWIKLPQTNVIFFSYKTLQIGMRYSSCYQCLLYITETFMLMQGWKTFFEEPIMLLAFVLLGKNLEQRAKLKATSDMSGLLSILPTKARLLEKKDSDQESSLVEVPSNSLAVGDHIVVLPGVSRYILELLVVCHLCVVSMRSSNNDFHRSNNDLGCQPLSLSHNWSHFLTWSHK